MNRKIALSNSLLLVFFSVFFPASVSGQVRGLESSDFYKMRSVEDAKFSPDGSRVAYMVINNDGPGRPYPQIWVMNLADGKSLRLGAEKDATATPTWSPDGQWLAYEGREGGRSGLVISHPDGSAARFLASMDGTNSPVPSTGKSIAWSPDG